MPDESFLWSKFVNAGPLWLAIFVVVSCQFPRMNAQDNRITGEFINGYTGVPFDTTNSPYDYLVDGDLAQDDLAGRRFKTLQAAYEAAPAGTPDRPTVIGIRPNVYLLPGGATTAGLEITKNYITLLGLTDDRRKVVLADNRGHMQGATDNGYVISVNSIGFTATNLTVLNYCNMDYEYPGDSSKDLKMRTPFDSQAVAMSMRGDRQVFSHVAFLGRHDTLYLQTARSYFKNVYVEGTEDFLGVGSGAISVWQDSEVYFPTGTGVMIAPGVTFINTVFKASHGLSFYKGLTTPATLIHCILPVNTPQSPVSWTLNALTTRQPFESLTYQTKDAKGAPATIYDSNVGPPTFKLSREISDKESAAFNPWNLLRVTSAGIIDDWDPAGLKGKYASQGSQVFRMAFVDDSQTATTKSTIAGRPPELLTVPSIHIGGPPARLRVMLYPAPAEQDSIVWSTGSNVIALDKTLGAGVLVTAQNRTNHSEYATVTARAPNGFHVTAMLKVDPAPVPAPLFSRAALTNSDGKATINYTLTPQGKDVSRITWYLCEDAQCLTRRKVAISRGDSPLKEYTLGIGAIGRYVEAEVEPKLDRSNSGAVAKAISATPIGEQEVKTSTVSPNFRNFVETSNDSYVSGFWTVLGTWQTVTNDNLVSWKSTTGDDLMNAYGLRAASRGASLLYQNDRPTVDMKIKVVMTPEKRTGEGFGSPGTGEDREDMQRGEVFIKYDPRTKTGYSLRFWHTIQSADTCMFQLFRIDSGKGTPVSPEQELTGVFKPNTTILLSIVGSTFTARGANSMDSDTLSLHATVRGNQFGGAGIYWSGTVYIGNSNIISQFEIGYPSAGR